MTKTRRTEQQRIAHLDIVAPVAYRALACRKADEFGIPQTIFSVVDRTNVHWFEVSNTFWADSSTVKIGELVVAPLVTMLPNNYFPVDGGR